MPNISHLSSYFLFIGRSAAGDPCRVHLMDVPEEIEKVLNASIWTYVGHTKDMAATPVDIKELPNAYVFIIDMHVIRSENMKVEIKDDNVLILSSLPSMSVPSGTGFVLYILTHKYV